MAKQREEEAPAGAPEWLLTFSDCMTLLLTFFVLLTSFATFDDETVPEISRACTRALLGSGSPGFAVEKTILPKNISISTPLQEKGSDVRTRAQKTNKNSLREKKPLDFKNLKVFTIESDKIFWAKGMAVTQQGEEALKMLKAYFLNTPGRIVISEYGPGRDASLGLERAMMIVEYFTRNGIDKNRLSISASPTTKETYAGRLLQITVLERSAYE